MTQTVFLRGARQLLTLRGPNTARRGEALRNVGLIPDGSVLIRDGIIVSVGSTRRLENLKEARRALEIPVHGKVVLPGFIDAGIRLSLDRSPEGQRPRRTAEFHEYSLSLMRACLQHGTVTAKVYASADSGNFSSDVAVLRKLEKICEQPVRMLRGWRIESDGAVSESSVSTTLQTLLKRRFIDSVAVASSLAIESASEAIATLRQFDLRPDLLWQSGPAHLLAQAIHASQPGAIFLSAPATDNEARLLAASSAIAIIRAGKQVLEGGPDLAAATRALIDAGGAVALSTGYHTSRAPNFNMQMAIALAVMRLGMSAEEAVAAATINAACAAGQAHVTGSLEPGKQADIVILNLPDLRELPQQFGVNHVAMVLRSGNVVLNRTRWRAPVEPPANRMRSKPF